MRGLSCGTLYSSSHSRNLAVSDTLLKTDAESVLLAGLKRAAAGEKRVLVAAAAVRVWSRDDMPLHIVRITIFLPLSVKKKKK